jgi:hypothetical protein
MRLGLLVASVVLLYELKSVLATQQQFSLSCQEGSSEGARMPVCGGDGGSESPQLTNGWP